MTIADPLARRSMVAVVVALMIAGCGGIGSDGGTGDEVGRGGTATTTQPSSATTGSSGPGSTVPGSGAYYVRVDGGSREQCTGTTDAAYPGSGMHQPCAWDHPFRALPPGGEAVLAGGGTLLIGPGEYMVGFGAPGAEDCDTDDRWGCAMPPVPSGPDQAHPTRIAGVGWDSGCPDPPQLWGAEAVGQLIDLTGASHIELACLEITDHAGCVEDHSGGLACPRDDYPFGNWASVGVYAEDSSDVHIVDVDIHGLADAGVRAGRLTDWTFERVRIAANGWVGWDGDIEGDDANSGTMSFRDWTVEWNGCVESYPGGDPIGCWGQSAGGYGDGLGTGETGATWIIEDSTFRYNTSDGLDLLYVRRDGAGVTVRRSSAYGNAGDQIKTGGPTLLENVIAVSNCGFFSGKAFTHDVDPCRSGGSAVALNTHRGGDAVIVNATIAGQGDCLIIAECAEGHDCSGSESVVVRNTILLGNPEFGGHGDVTCLAWSAFDRDPFDFDHVIIDGVKTDRLCPPASRCDAGTAVVDASLDVFDAHLGSGSIAIDAGTGEGAPVDDFAGHARNNPPDIGAYEAG
ncbi:MAG: right-handed parallel beta-helix repeat-containing protein [Acidimicrobiia bacterium]|nr:right-handed parallel beta-helix repeat-containing protein [Acidimicrobiia bacterium]